MSTLMRPAVRLNPTGCTPEACRHEHTTNSGRENNSCESSDHISNLETQNSKLAIVASLL
jgi:hypothetical protein